MEQSNPRTESRSVDPLELARRVKAKRENEGLSLREAAKQLDMSAATLSRVESGAHLPERDHLLALANWVDLPLDRGARRRRNAAVHGKDAGTLEAVELHLRADKELKSEDADILVDLVRAAYKRMNTRK